MFIDKDTKKTLIDQTYSNRKTSIKNEKDIVDKIDKDDVVECENCKAMVRKNSARRRQNLKKDITEGIIWFHPMASGITHDYELETLHFCQKCAPEDTLLNDKKPVKEIVTNEKQPEGKHVCDQCDFTTDSQRGLSIHKGAKHK